MEAMIGISLYSFLFSHVSKNAMSFLLSHVFSSTKLENKKVEQVLLRSRRWKVGKVGQLGGGGGPNNVYTCK
jgi:hypothetical protein